MTTINIDRLVSFESDLKKLAKKHNVQIRENADLLFIFKKDLYDYEIENKEE